MHTIREQYNLITAHQGLASDFQAMIDWLQSQDMSPCNSDFFGAEVNAILVKSWINFRDSLTNSLLQYERNFLEETALRQCEPNDVYDLRDCLDETSDGQLMAIGRLFYQEQVAGLAEPSITDISIVWWIADVQSIRPDLSDVQAAEVLQFASHKHNAEIGINWDVLLIHAEYLYPKPS